LKETICLDLGRRYSNPEVCEILDLASFLDSRFKEQHLFDKEGTKQKIIDQCLQYYKIVNVSEATENPTHSPESSCSDVQVLCPATIKRSSGCASTYHRDNDSEHVTPLTPLQEINKEITSY